MALHSYTAPEPEPAAEEASKPHPGLSRPVRTLQERRKNAVISPTLFPYRRMQAMTATIVPEVFGFEGYTLDVTRGCLRREDREIELRPKTFDVLRYLVRNAGRLIPKEELIAAAWPNVVVTDDAI